MLSYNSKLILIASEYIIHSYINYLLNKLSDENHIINIELNHLSGNSLSENDFNYTKNIFQDMIQDNLKYMELLNQFLNLYTEFCNTYDHEVSILAYNNITSEINYHIVSIYNAKIHENI